MLSNLFLKGSALSVYVMCCQDLRSAEEMLRYPEFMIQVSFILVAREGVKFQITLDITVKKLNFKI